MSERRTFLDNLSYEQYSLDAASRAVPMSLEAGCTCRLRIDISAFKDYGDAPDHPTPGEVEVRIRSKLENENRWSMLVLNIEKEVDAQEPASDFYATFDADGLLQRFDAYPVEGDLLRSIDYARSRYLASDELGGYVLAAVNAELTAPHIDLPASDLDAEFADLLSSN